MSKYPALNGKDIVKALTTAGFQKIRQKGSHLFLRHPDGRATVVPVHPGENIGPGLISKILRDVEMDKEEFYLLVNEGKR